MTIAAMITAMAGITTDITITTTSNARVSPAAIWPSRGSVSATSAGPGQGGDVVGAVARAVGVRAGLDGLDREA